MRPLKKNTTEDPPIVSSKYVFPPKILKRFFETILTSESYIDEDGQLQFEPESEKTHEVNIKRIPIGEDVPDFMRNMPILTPDPMGRIEKTINQDVLQSLKQLVDSQSDTLSSFKTRQPKLIMKQSNITKTGQVPNYYLYYDSKGNPKRRPVEPEEYDRYVRENKR